MNVDTESAIYDQWLLERVVHSVRHGARSFNEVLNATIGADPMVVCDALRRAVRSGNLEPAATALINNVAEDGPDSTIEPMLPQPHPLDFEWRFSRLGGEYILAKSSGQGVGDLCLVGATTVALLASTRGWQGRLVSLDVDGLILENAHRLHSEIEVKQIDVIRNVLPSFKTETVVADPPWYPEYIKGFLWASARLCTGEGRVLLIVPGEGTRPGVAADRAEVLRM